MSAIRKPAQKRRHMADCVVVFIKSIDFEGKAEGEMGGMQVKQLSCYYPAVMRQSHSNHLSCLAYRNFNLF